MARLHSARAALGILSGLNLLNYIDRYLASGMLPLIAADLKLTDADSGLLFSAFIVTYVLVSPLAGWLGDRRARFPLAAVGVLIWSAATFGSGLAPTLAVFLVVRALVGVGEASYSVVTPSLLSDFYPAEQRGRVLAFFYAAIPLGSALGFGLGGLLGQHVGWRPAFFFAGGPGAILAVALLFLRDPPRGGFDRSRDGPDLKLTIPGALKELWSRRSFVYTTVAQTIYTFTMGGLAVWMPTYFVRERHLALDTAGLMFGGVLCCAGFAGTLIGGKLGDKLAARSSSAHFQLSAWALIASLPFTALAILSRQPAIFWPAMGITLFLLFLNTGPLYAVISNVLPATLRGQGFAINTVSIHLLGDVISPPLIGSLSDRVGLKWPVFGAGALLVVAGLVLLAGRPALERDLARVG
ncbi:MAG TPA: MFS transporter [Polyangia bacterium]|jgi:MFS family permease|nr:MFS transporter [Polyangia bacterium]